MAGITRIPRSRGALSGVLLILLGAWGGLIPFIGPYFHYAYTPDKTWTYTTGRLWLEILPAAATMLGGLILLVSARRPVAMFGAFVAALGGAWFVVGNLVSTLWNGGTPEAGVPVGSTLNRLAIEELGFFIGLGVVIVFFAAVALGRCAVIGVKDAALAERAAGLGPADRAEVAPQPTPAFAGPAASAAPAHVASESYPSQEESYQPAGAVYTGEHDESPTITGRVPADRAPVTPADQDERRTRAESVPPSTTQSPSTSPSGTVPPA